MAKKKIPRPVVSANWDAVVSADPDAPTTRDPQQWIGLDRSANGVIDYVPGRSGLFKFEAEGKVYEHCSTDDDGVWIYRAVAY